MLPKFGSPGRVCYIHLFDMIFREQSLTFETCGTRARCPPRVPRVVRTMSARECPRAVYLFQLTARTARTGGTRTQLLSAAVGKEDVLLLLHMTVSAGDFSSSKGKGHDTKTTTTFRCVRCQLPESATRSAASSVAQFFVLRCRNTPVFLLFLYFYFIFK